jgi:hypothetical protein
LGAFLLDAFLLGAFCAASLAAMPAPARAAGFLDFLFGSSGDRPAAPPVPVPPAPVNSYAEPMRVAPPPLGAETVRAAGGGTGHIVAFCVRLCDGENFPLDHYPNATPIETCRALCPASKTAVYFGTAIDNAVARDGARYADLAHADLYRKNLVENCTCNGRNVFGLAPIDRTSDPTLRRGDIVVTKDGLMAYAGRRDGAATYTPVDPATVSAELNSVTAPPRNSRRTDAPRHTDTGIIVESQNAAPQYLPPVVDLRGQLGK